VLFSRGRSCEEDHLVLLCTVPRMSKQYGMLCLCTVVHVTVLAAEMCALSCWQCVELA
jgi:hypothetical protein